jgi:hypothetical protein
MSFYRERRLTVNHRAALSVGVLLAALGLAAHAGQATDAKKPTGSGPGLDRFKQLAGDWVGTIGAHNGKEAQTVQVNYKVTSGGSAIMETIAPKEAMEMVTVIHKDGDDLVLTHYCAVGNQPRMKADRGGDDNKVAFKFTGASNMKSDKDMHMHAVTYTFVDKDTLKAEWTHYMDGKEGGKALFELKRKK